MIKWFKGLVFYLILAAGAHSALARTGLDLFLTLGSNHTSVGPFNTSFLLMADGTGSVLLANGYNKLIINN